MSDDLVKRLRSLGSAGPGRISFLASEDAMKAADRIEKDAAHIDEMYELVAAMTADHTASKTRIEKLEAALREIAGNGNATGCNPQIMCDIARKALDAE
jgi:hypothetical protein